MHIADFTVGHLGANAIVGGGVPIATGAALANRYFERGNVVCCFPVMALTPTAWCSKR